MSISDKTDDVVFVARTAFTSYNTWWSQYTWRSATSNTNGVTNIVYREIFKDLGTGGFQLYQFISCSQLQNLNKNRTNSLYLLHVTARICEGYFLLNKRTTNYPVTGIARSVSSCSCVPKIFYLSLVHWFTSHPVLCCCFHVKYEKKTLDIYI